MIPADIEEIHRAFIRLATPMVALTQHPPLVFFDHCTPRGFLVDLSSMFETDEEKSRAATYIKWMAAARDVQEAVMLVEATMALVPPAMVGSGDLSNLTIADGIDPQDVLNITIERPGEVYQWCHPIETLDGGSRRLNPEGYFNADGIAGYDRFRMLAENLTTRS